MMKRNGVKNHLAKLRKKKKRDSIGGDKEEEENK